jgi:hypothetical protein
MVVSEARGAGPAKGMPEDCMIGEFFGPARFVAGRGSRW